MPFNVWCDGCNHLIAKGVRFNAEKKHHGNYFSTKIWSFKMLSPCCQTPIEVRTDPKTTEYLVISGARRKVEDYDAEAAGTAVLPSAAEREAINSNPFARLENGQVRAGSGGRRRVVAVRGWEGTGGGLASGDARAGCRLIRPRRWGSGSGSRSCMRTTRRSMAAATTT